MLITLINDLTKEQRLELHIKGITSPVMSMWRTGHRKPTFAQCVSLAEVTNADLNKILIEVALDTATPEQRQKFEHLLNQSEIS